VVAELAINGGTPVRESEYPRWPASDDCDVEAVAAIVRSGRWGGWPEPGPRAAEFEDAFAAYQGARHGILMSNGTVTMEVALKALGIGWGDEVIVPALTFSATAYAPMAAGALPVFVDVTPQTWTLDPEQTEAAVTSRTRAIMPVHLGHQMADMDRIMEVARKHFEERGPRNLDYSRMRLQVFGTPTEPVLELMRELAGSGVPVTVKTLAAGFNRLPDL
jgi:hypothetical protein